MSNHPSHPVVLVVDDNPDFLLFCRSVLGPAGYRVITAASAAEGRQVLRTDRPEVVLLDVMMEQVDAGFSLAEEVARQPDPPEVALVSQIADAANGVMDTSLLPVARFVNKPLPPAVLLGMVDDLTSRRRARPVVSPR